MSFVLYVLLGVLAGTLAGLFGVGGGLVVVPILIFNFELQGVSPDIMTHLAVGTSLATIVVTSIGSIRIHHKKGAVLWPIFIYLAPGTLLGAAFGVVTGVSLKGETLQSAFGLFSMLISIRMWFGWKSVGSDKHMNKAVLAVAGTVIGWVSSMLGIGGGSLSVPLLCRANVGIRRAVGTSAACSLPIAVTDSLVNIIMGMGHPSLPEWSTGFVYWPGFFGIILTSVFFASIGAHLAHRFSVDKLQKFFSVFLFLVGVQLLLQSFP
ncbi:MAG: sulfite exporter TauE/SafE family protein [Candidatus Endonucleobacter bathymodioli]|uniref:Probable membrane transporter protein n=1 Tax=Candidatus Endonucleibacter bathymodioli TaxID=539814 RepID=A0AA90NYR6_9GAMM|nr:sulfite exporter TauE/SafE family protein [Candidatus Endonucleobacter bathymodioli]